MNRIVFFARAHLVHHRLDAFLELTAVFRAGNHHRQIEHHDAAIQQQLGHVPLDHLLGEPLDDGRLAHARLAQQHGIVLRAPTEDLHGPLDFFLAADNRIELALPGKLRQIAAEAVQRGRFRFAAAGRRFAAATAAARQTAGPLRALGAFDAVPQQVQNLLADLFQLEPQVHQHLGGDAFLLAEQSQQDMFGADVVVVEVPGLFHRVFNHLLRPRRLRQLAHRDHVGAALHQFLDFQPDLAEIDVEILQHIGRHSAAFLDQPQQDVFGADIFVVEPLSLLVRQLHHFSARSVNRSYINVLRSCYHRAAERRPMRCISVLRGRGRFVSRLGQQIAFLVNFDFPLLRALEALERVELPGCFVETPGTPQHRGQHQPGVHVADVSPQQAFENLFRLVVVAFQVVVHGRPKESSFGSARRTLA